MISVCLLPQSFYFPFPLDTQGEELLPQHLFSTILQISKALVLNWFGFHIKDPENHSTALWYYSCILPIFYFFIWCLYSNWQNDWFSCIKYAQKTKSKLRLEKTDLAENWILFKEQVYSWIPSFKLFELWQSIVWIAKMGMGHYHKI